MAGNEETSATDVTVVVPTRNRAGIVRRLLHQLAHLDEGPRYEVIVIDEASSDATPALLAEMSARHGFRVVRHDPPRGLPGARNVGLDLASSPWIAWIDDDDLTSPDRLRRQWEALESTDARWSCAGRVDVDDELEIIGFRRCPPVEGLLPALLRFNVLPTAAQGLLVDTQLARDIGGYDESLDSAEDWEFCIRLAAAAPAHMLDEPLVGYRTGVESMSTNTARMESAIRRVTEMHTDLYRQHGVDPDWAGLHESLLAADLLAGRRAATARAAKALAAAPGVRSLVRLGWIALAPEHYQRWSAGRRHEQVDDEWRVAARRWLDDVLPIEGIGH